MILRTSHQRTLSFQMKRCDWDSTPNCHNLWRLRFSQRWFPHCSGLSYGMSDSGFYRFESSVASIWTSWSNMFGSSRWVPSLHSHLAGERKCSCGHLHMWRRQTSLGSWESNKRFELCLQWTPASNKKDLTGGLDTLPFSCHNNRRVQGNTHPLLSWLF